MRQTHNIVTVLVGIAAAWWLASQTLGLLSRFADVLAIFGFAWLLNLLLEPMVDRLSRRFPKGLAWSIGYVCVLLVLMALTAPLATQASTLPNALPKVIEQSTRQIDMFLVWLREHHFPVPMSSRIAMESSELVQQIAPILVAWSLAILSFGGQTLLVIGVAAAMTAGDNSVRPILRAALPRTWLDEATWLYQDVRRTYSAAIRGHLAIWTLGMILSLGVMALFNTPNVFLWIGPLALVRLLPYLGGILGGAMTVLILLLTLPWPIALIPAILVIIGQNLMGYIIEPHLLGRVLRLSPALVLFVVLVGWKLGGVAGIAFGVPAVAVVQAIAERILSYRERRRSLQPDAMPIEPAPAVQSSVSPSNAAAAPPSAPTPNVSTAANPCPESLQAQS
ncbi:MAG: AI-2E family transporter [Chloroflexales bacterium]|nr:AI-2E family transporter [Chloroflexales bacterium]